MYEGVHDCTIRPMGITVTASEARATLPDVLGRVAEGHEVTITRHGKPVAVVVRPDALRVRRAEGALAAAASVADRLARARSTPLSTRPTLDERRAAELVTDIDAERSARAGEERSRSRATKRSSRRGS